MERDLRAECKEVVLNAIEKATNDPDKDVRIDIILREIEPWLGSLDSLMHRLHGVQKYNDGEYVGTINMPGIPIRPDGPYLGFSDALEEIDVDKTDLRIIISLFTLSFRLQKRIPAYRDFYERTKKMIETTKPDKDIQGYLMGFEPKDG